MYERVGVSRSDDLLAVIATWPAERRDAAHATIREIEEEALTRLSLTNGAAELGRWCAERGLPLGLVTRNNAAAVDYFHANVWSPLPLFSPALARDAGLAHKPNPAALLRCAEVWGVHPQSCVMIGDSPRDDVVAGRRAGMRTILLTGEYTRDTTRDVDATGERTPCATAVTLADVPAILESLFTVVTPAKR